jgi:hypothetical protein
MALFNGPAAFQVVRHQEPFALNENCLVCGQSDVEMTVKGLSTPPMGALHLEVDGESCREALYCKHAGRLPGLFGSGG